MRSPGEVRPAEPVVPATEVARPFSPSALEVEVSIAYKPRRLWNHERAAYSGLPAMYLDFVKFYRWLYVVYFALAALQRLPPNAALALAVISLVLILIMLLEYRGSDEGRRS